jgi:hypothetical protein
MVDERSSTTTTATSDEAKQLGDERDRLLEASARLPEVADVLEVYGRLAPYVSAPGMSRAPTRYATGGSR